MAEVYVNGRFLEEPAAAISALDRGLTLGDGLFETMRASEFNIFRLGDHLARLRRGAEVLAIPLPSDEELTAALQETLRRADLSEAVLRLTVTRGPDPGRGIAIPAEPSPTVIIRATPFTPPPPTVYERGYRAVISSIRRNETSPLSRVKSLNYGDNILARMEAQSRGRDDEAIMLNTRGEVACGTTSNIFVVHDGELLTPPVESGALPGITRLCVLELAQELSIPAREHPVLPDELLAADEAFLTNTVLGLIPLTAINSHPIGSGKAGPMSAKLRQSYRDVGH
ncbi:MAG: aminotransferase class IV family protein [Chloroflexi bacterium]|nr:aminotransferase class IV family protein [Chloroflexota bacterium]